jgi:uncharacterized protein YkwD
LRDAGLVTILTAMLSPRRRSTSVATDRHRGSRVAIAALSLLATAALAVVPAASAAQRHHRRARAASGCANANANVGPASAQALRAAVVCLINQQRTSRHLPALRASHLLDGSAQGWTNAMVSSDVFSHGTNFAARISAAGYVWRAAGENIATGFQTPAGVVRAWMASTGHCQNILNPTYGNVGTGVSRRPVNGWASGAGTWTQDFALSMYKSPPSANWGPADGCPY